jgi:hypothetical protein
MARPYRSLAVLAIASSLHGLATPRLAAGCADLDDPYQVLDLHLELAPADWEAIVLDETYELERPASFHCGEETPIPANVRRKRGRLLQEPPTEPVLTEKVSLKIDLDDLVEDGEWHGHRKLSLENGSRVWDEGVLLREGLSWWLMAHAGMVTGQASWVRLHVNGRAIGVYTRVEQVDKSFLRRRVGEDGGFLWKGDPTVFPPKRQETREGETDPWAEALCFEPFEIGRDVCSAPPGAFEGLSAQVDLHQLLTLGAVNSIIANIDGPLSAPWNCFWYDSPRPRLYVPWDLDAGLYSDYLFQDPHTTQDGGAKYYQLLIARPEIRDRYDAILGRLIREVSSPEIVGRLLDALAPTVGQAIDADPLNLLTGGFAGEAERTRRWFETRCAFLEWRLPPYEPFPVAINEILAANASIHADAGGDHDDWVELHNRGETEVSLGGLFLTDDPAEPFRWALPDVALPPGGFVLVWCDGEPGEDALHATFKLDAAGEAVGLYEAAEGGGYLLRDFVRFERQETDVSWGRLPDGTPGFHRLECPSPHAENRSECAAAPRFSRGDFTDDGRLSISDPIGLLGGLFQGAGIPCRDAADPDDDGRVNITDVVYLLEHLFRGGPAPAEPSLRCGEDPTEDALECASYASCK